MKKRIMASIVAVFIMGIIYTGKKNLSRHFLIFFHFFLLYFCIILWKESFCCGILIRWIAKQCGENHE